MMDLNMDRLLMGVGAVIMGAMLIAGLIHTFPDIVSNWSQEMAGSVRSMQSSRGYDTGLDNLDFEANGAGWTATTSDVRFDGKTAYVPAGDSISRQVNVRDILLAQGFESKDIQSMSSVDLRVSFKGRGSGSTRVRFNNSNELDWYSDHSLRGSSSSYNSTLKNLPVSGGKISFETAASSKLILDSVWFKIIPNK